MHHATTRTTIRLHGGSVKAYTRKAFGVSVGTETIEEANIAPSSVDIITLHHVLEHLPNPFASLSILNSWLREGGIIAVDVPDLDNIPRSVINHFHYAHIYNFNHRTLAAMLEKAGFTVLVGEGSQNTGLCAKKTGVPDMNREINLQDNYRALWSKLTAPEEPAKKRSRSTKRLAGKLKRYPLEIIESLLVWSPKRIADREWKKGGLRGKI